MDQQINQRLYFLKQLAKYRLSEQERHELVIIIQQYQANKLVENFVQQLVALLAPENKLQLLKDIRNIVYKHNLNYYDQLVALCLQMRTISAPRKTLDHHIISKVHRRSKTAPVIYSSDDACSDGYFSLPRKTKTNYNELKNLRNWTLPNKPIKVLSKFKVINFSQPDKFEDLGFSICGGKENNSSIYIGDISQHGPAGKTDLVVGDAIVEVNGLSLDHMSLHSVVKLLKNLREIKLIIRTNDWLYNKRKFVSVNPWTGEEKISSPKVDDRLSVPTSPKHFEEARKQFRKPFIKIQDNEFSDSASERCVELALVSTQPVGFSIRGGSEFGVGIFISSVESGSTAEKSGLKTGDLILAVNGRDFQNISHNDAVEFIKCQNHLIIRLKSVGKIPEGRQLVHEYSWLGVDGKRETSRNASPTPTILARSVSQLSTLTSTVSEITDIPFDSRSPIPTIAVESVETQVLEEDLLGRKDACVQVLEEPTKSKTVVTSTPLRTERFHGRVSSHGSGDKIQTSRSSSFTDLTDIKEKFQLKQLDKKKFGSLDTLCDSKSFFRRQGDKILKAFSTKKKNIAHDSKRNLFASVLFDEPEDKMKLLDLKLQEIMTVADYKLIQEHLKDYLGKGDVEIFAIHLLDIVGDKEDVLPYIRNIVLPHDIGRFDCAVAKHQSRKIAKPGKKHQSRKLANPATPVIYDNKKQSRHDLIIPVESPTNPKYHSKTIVTSAEERNKKGVKSLDYSVSQHCISPNMLGSMRHMPQPSLMYTGMLQPDVLRYRKIQSGGKRSGKSDSIDFSSFLNDDDFKGAYPFGSCDLPPAKLSIMKNYRTQKVSTFRDILPNRKNSARSSKSEENEEGLNSCYIYSPRLKQLSNVEPQQKLCALYDEEKPYRIRQPRFQSNDQKENPFDDLIFDDMDEEENEDVPSSNQEEHNEDLYTTVDKTCRHKRLNQVGNQIKVSDSFTSYDVATSMSAKLDHDNTVSIRNVKINKPNKVYEFSSERLDRDDLQNTSFSSGVSSCSDDHLITQKVLKDEECTNHFHEVELSKDHQSLGLSICGGNDVKMQRDAKIFSISPDSSAGESNLTIGQVLISVDGESLVDVTHKEAVNLLRLKYKDRSTNIMRIVVADH